MNSPSVSSRVNTSLINDDLDDLYCLDLSVRAKTGFLINYRENINSYLT